MFINIIINYEGFGITNLEAMSLGCPVITLILKYSEKLVENHAYILKLKNHLDLKKQIVKVLLFLNKKKINFKWLWKVKKIHLGKLIQTDFKISNFIYLK